MILKNLLRRFSVVVAASAFAAVAFSTQAQEIGESHLKASYAAISAIHATDLFDLILPQAAAALKQHLIQQNPNMQEVITHTVDEKTLMLAARRADLEKESAVAYAKAFSEQNLKDIAAFYNSESGKKLVENGPFASRELVKAAEIWQNGIARDLAEQVSEKIKTVIASKASAEDAAPATPVD